MVRWGCRRWRRQSPHHQRARAAASAQASLRKRRQDTDHQRSLNSPTNGVGSRPSHVYDDTGELSWQTHQQCGGHSRWDLTLPATRAPRPLTPRSTVTDSRVLPLASTTPVGPVNNPVSAMPSPTGRRQPVLSGGSAMSNCGHLGRRTVASSAVRDLVTGRRPGPDHPTGQVVQLSRACDVVGRLYYSTLLGNRPHVLVTWRVTSDYPHVVERVAELLGAHTSIPDADTYSGVVTNAATVEVVLDDPSAIDVRWYLNNERACDEQDECRCPPSLPERKLAARAGRGCEPRMRICFRLHQDVDLGIFVLVSGSWSLIEDGARARQALRSQTGPVVAHLGLERHVFALHSGGRIAYTRPRLISAERPGQSP